MDKQWESTLAWMKDQEQINRELMAMIQSMATPRTTESPTKASPSGVPAPASTAQPNPASSHPLGDLTWGDCFHVARCSECQAQLERLRQAFRTLAPDVHGSLLSSTSAKPDSSGFAATSPEVFAPSASSASNDVAAGGEG